MEAGAGLHDQPPHSRVGSAHVLAVIAAAALIGLAVGIGAHFLLAGPARSTAPISTLRDQGGGRFSLASLHGRTIAMVFFDSHCHQACPLEGRALAAAEQTLPAAQRPVVVVVSVNPLDTAASTRSAVRKWGLAQVGAWHWLRGDQAALARVWKAYRIFVAPPRNGDISHTEALYLIDRHGDERSGYLYPFLPRFVTHDLRTLALAGAGQGAS